MTNALYTRLLATGLRLLTKYGQAVTLRTYTAGTYNATTLTTTPTTADTTRQAAIFPYNAGQMMAAGGLIQEADRLCYMDASGSAPNLRDHVLVGSDEYVIQAIKEYNPAGTPVLYELQLRK